MQKQKRLFMEAQAVISHLFIRVLCLIIVEYECLMRILEASGRDYTLGNRFLVLSFIIAAILCSLFPRKKWGYIIGIVTAAFNIIVKFYFVFSGHEHYPYWPIVWIGHSVVIIYFCIQGLLVIRSKQSLPHPE